MKIKKYSLVAFFYGLLFSFIVPVFLHADNIEENVTARGNNVQLYAGYSDHDRETFEKFIELGGEVWTGGSEQVAYIIKKNGENWQHLEEFKKSGRTFWILDKGSLVINILKAGKKGDLIGIGEALIDDYGSSTAAAYGVAILGGLGITSYGILIVGGAGGASFYTLTKKHLVKYLADKINAHADAIENELYSHTEKSKMEVESNYYSMCLKIRDNYAKTGIRPSKLLINLCKSNRFIFSIDVLDQCPDNPYKRKRGICGCKPDIDSDGDGVLDCNDKCEDNPKLTDSKGHNDLCLQTEEEWQKEQLDKKKCPKNAIAKWSDEENRPRCYCKKGFVLSESGRECIGKEEVNSKPFISCKDRGGVTIYRSGSFTSNCVCEKPLVWNKDETKCICPAGTKIDEKENKCVKDRCGRKLSREERDQYVKQLKNIEDTRWSQKKVPTYNEFGTLRYYIISENAYNVHYERNIPIWKNWVDCWDACIMSTPSDRGMNTGERKIYVNCLRRCRNSFNKSVKNCP